MIVQSVQMYNLFWIGCGIYNVRNMWIPISMVMVKMTQKSGSFMFTHRDINQLKERMKNQYLITHLHKRYSHMHKGSKSLLMAFDIDYKVMSEVALDWWWVYSSWNVTLARELLVVTWRYGLDCSLSIGSRMRSWWRWSRIVLGCWFIHSKCQKIRREEWIQNPKLKKNNGREARTPLLKNGKWNEMTMRTPPHDRRSQIAATHARSAMEDERTQETRTTKRLRF